MPHREPIGYEPPAAAEAGRRRGAGADFISLASASALAFSASSSLGGEMHRVVMFIWMSQGGGTQLCRGRQRTTACTRSSEAPNQAAAGAGATTIPHPSIAT